MAEIDPLDKAAAAQLDFTKGSKKGGKKAPQAADAAQGAEGAEQAAEAAPEKAAEAAPEKAPETAVVTTKTIYIVEEERKVLLTGQKVTLRKGKVIDPAGYGGEAGIAALKAQGVKLAEAQQPI